MTDNTSRNLVLGIGAVVIIGLIFFFVANGGKKQDSKQPILDMSSWLTSDDPARGISFKYPASIGTKYVSLLDWPPQVAVVDGPFNCVETETSASSKAGQTKKEIINGKEYCVTRVVEGAAGSTYTQYAYAGELDGRVAILTFSLRTPQCANYDKEKKAECETEVSTFDIGLIIDQIMSTLVLGMPSLDYEKG